jgi:hypothetical protein
MSSPRASYLKTAEKLKPNVTAVDLSLILHVTGFIHVCNIGGIPS